MIQPTVKAQTLPDDLKKHWEDAMAAKFPMTKEEAAAYIQNHWGNKVSVMITGDSVQVGYVKTVEVPEGAYPPPGYSGGMRYPHKLTVEYYKQEYALITDFTQPRIQEQVTDLLATDSEAKNG